MKAAIKMTKTEFSVFFLLSILAGFMIGLGGTASLLAANLFGSWGKLVGACLFSLGIYAIITHEMKLFTGMVANIPQMGLKNMWQLAAVFIGNALGVALTALLVCNSPLAATVVPQGASVISAKLYADGWPLKAACSGALCGFLITLSVWGPKFAPKKGLCASVEVILPIVVFAFCGFDHSVANMLYFYFLGEFSLQVVLYILCTIAGNIAGGVFLPLVVALKEKAEAQKKENA